MRQTVNFRNLGTPTVFPLPFGKIALDQQSLPHRAILASTPVRDRGKPGAVGVLVTLPADQQAGAGRGFAPVYGVAGLEPYSHSGYPPLPETKIRELRGLRGFRRPPPPRPLIMAYGRRGMAGLGEDSWFQKDFVKPFLVLAKEKPWLMLSGMVAMTLLGLAAMNNAGKLVAVAGK